MVFLAFMRNIKNANEFKICFARKNSQYFEKSICEMTNTFVHALYSVEDTFIALNSAINSISRAGLGETNWYQLCSETNGLYREGVEDDWDTMGRFIDEVIDEVIEGFKSDNIEFSRVYDTDIFELSKALQILYLLPTR